jgi:hypothetical protein
VMSKISTNNIHPVGKGVRRKAGIASMEERDLTTSNDASLNRSLLSSFNILLLVRSVAQSPLLFVLNHANFSGNLKSKTILSL